MRYFGMENEVTVEEYEVFEENWDALQIFLACQTQWNVGGMGSIIGLNYQSVELFMRLNGVESKENFDKVRVMEVEALKLFNKKEKSRGR